MSDHEDNTTNERPGTSTDSGAQNMPSANVFADMFKAALAPVLSQLTTLNKNVSAVLLNEHEDSEEDGEAASNDRPAMSADMDADLSALLVSAGKDDNTEAMPREDLLKELAQELAVSEKTSPPLREGLAAIFNNLLSEKMGDEKLKAKLDKYPRPENVKGLRTPKVNPSIWSQLSTSMKTHDVRSQKGQNTLISAISAMTKAADLALGKYSNDKELITLLTDAVAMALQYNHEVNHSRRLAMKREMHKDYAALCNLSTVDGTSEYLFGDLSKLSKDITEANKLRKKVRPQHSGTSRGDKYAGRSTYGSSQRRFQPYSRPLIFRQKPLLKAAEKEKGRRNEPAPMKVPEVCNANMTSLPIDIVHSLVKSQTSFQAGKFKHFLPLWEAITADPTILQIVTGVAQEIEEFISTIFLRPKKNGTYRTILNLKAFNEFIAHHHFKMDTLEAAVNMMRPGYFMALVDLKDAYYTVPIHASHQKYLKFCVDGALYKYTCLPYGLASAPRIFT